MSYSVYSYAVYGIKMKKEELMVTTSGRGCSHKETDSKFCSECGKPMFIETTEMLEFENENEATGKVTRFYDDYNGKDCIVGIGLGSTGYDNNYGMISLVKPNMMVDLMAFFQTHNLPFDSNKVHSYIMTYHSY